MKLSDTLGTTLGTVGIIFIFITLWFFYVGCDLCAGSGLCMDEEITRPQEAKNILDNTSPAVNPYQPPAKPTPLNVAPTDIRFEERRPEEGGPGSIRRGC